MDWLRSLTAAWQSRIKEAETSKQRLFGKTAKQLWAFLTRSYRDLYMSPSTLGEGDQDITVFPTGTSGPLYKPRLNKCQEYVDLYLPHLLSELPGRAVLPNRPQFPEMAYMLPVAMGQAGGNGQQAVPFGMVDAQARFQVQMAATLLGWWLNYTPQEYNLLKEAWLAATEALVKGRGMLWHELLPTGSGLIPVSLYDSVDNYIVDPHTTTLRDAGYIGRKRTCPVWLASRRLGISETKLLAVAKRQEIGQSSWSEAPPSADIFPGDVEMVEYYEIWSRIGIGHVMVSGNDTLKNLNEALDSLGPFVWLAIAEGSEAPLNLHEDLLIDSPDRLRAALEWPLATYGETADP
jgi:hypothetical protein